MNLLFLPHFLGAPKKRGLLLPKRAAAFWEGTQWCKGGTGKAEAAKLQHAGISLKQSYIRECQEKHLPLGSVPRYFSLGIQPKWLDVHP